jgi:hypothetical protein
MDSKDVRLAGHRGRGFTATARALSPILGGLTCPFQLLFVLLALPWRSTRSSRRGLVTACLRSSSKVMELDGIVAYILSLEAR